MRLIKPYFEIWNQPSSLEGVYKQIERVGRVCYKSEDKITEDSAKPFVDNRLIKSGHYAMLEHGTVYLKRDSTKEDNLEWAERYLLSPYSRISYGEGSHRINGVLHNTVYVTTNYRVIIEQGWLDDLQYICEPTEYHERRVTVHFVCDRGISHEFVRHRVMSFAQESTRYCNYSKDKFNNELTFIQPCWLNDEKLKLYGSYHTVIRDKSPESIFIANLNNAEKDYLDLIKAWMETTRSKSCFTKLLKDRIDCNWICI